MASGITEAVRFRWNMIGIAQLIFLYRYEGRSEEERRET